MRDLRSPASSSVTPGPLGPSPRDVPGPPTPHSTPCVYISRRQEICMTATSQPATAASSCLTRSNGSTHARRGSWVGSGSSPRAGCASTAGTAWSSYHLHETVMQGAFREATRAAGIAKPATCHSLRHTAPPICSLKAGYDIRTIQELPGHKDVSTTMIYTHVANTGPRGVKSPLDEDR